MLLKSPHIPVIADISCLNALEVELKRKYSIIAAKVTMMNCLGYATAIMGPALIDPQLNHHVKYGARQYPFAIFLTLVASSLFLLFYFIVSRTTTKKWLYATATLPMLLLIAPALWVLLPEIPHAGFLMIFTGTLIFSSLTIIFHDAVNSQSELNDPEIVLEGRIEYIKSTLDLWRTSIFGGVLAFVSFALGWVELLKASIAMITTDPGEQFLLRNSLSLLLILWTLFFIAGPVHEGVKSIISLTKAFLALRTPHK